MDFEFTKNTLLGDFRARFTMEHQIIGRLLEDELGKDRTKIDQVVTQLEKAQLFPTKTFVWQGTELRVVFYEYEISVLENSTYLDITDDFDDNLSLYESESSASCGLEDFSLLLNKWVAFIEQ